MNKNILTIIVIFLIPLALYFGLTKDKFATPQSVAATGAEILKFSSPMCYECQELEKIFDEVFEKYDKNIKLKKIYVTNRDKATNELIKEYSVKLVPTTVFIKDGSVLRRIEGTMQPKILENYLKELTNG